MGISSTGIGSGLEVESIITKLVTLEKQPLTTLQTKAAIIQTKISDYSQIKSLVSTLSDAASKMTLDSGWNSLSVSSSNSAAVSAAVTGLATATSFSVGVSQLAKAQSTVSTAVTAGAALGSSGTLTLQLGTWASNAFTAGSAPSVAVTVAATDTMAQIATKINDSGSGLVATVLTDASGDRLMLRSSATGEAAGFRILATDGDGNDTDSSGLSRLGFDLSATTAYGMGANTYQAGQNAKATINGIAVTSTTNKFKDVIAGLTITASEVTGSNVEISATNDKEALTTNIQAFVDAYNAINKYLADATAYDSTSKTSGDLQGDATAIGLRNSLRSMMGTATTGGSVTRLYELGISMGQDGNLTVNAAKLSTALDTPDKVKTFFAQNNNDTASNGLARKVKAFTTDLLSFSGAMNNKADALAAETKRNTAEQDKVTARAAAVEKRLRATYTALDTKMATLSALSTYITQQVEVWNSSNSN
ncbi:flagellar hook-associated protein 2 [Rhodoferax sp. OV413]|uniref:flagellar filament capping protein FliD n=1 Tax=Rhodoferax sp. OV413 TaxID=1855285 RepID=UPI00088797D3|nr:flagellar filament capping protein FliD [Rhodoferax sp. OV413]SDP93339.1 flagellar hook-associated protein 2 [Rhodoferax sp. OV413]